MEGWTAFVSSARSWIARIDMPRFNVLGEVIKSAPFGRFIKDSLPAIFLCFIHCISRRSFYNISRKTYKLFFLFLFGA